MSPIKSASHWFLLFFIFSTQLKVLLAQIDYYGDYTGNAVKEDEGTYQPDFNYYDPRPRRSSRYSYPEHNAIYHPISKRIGVPYPSAVTNKPTNIVLCQNLDGCECKYDRVNCTCEVNGTRNRNQVNSFLYVNVVIRL